jgi:hypothetical protein
MYGAERYENDLILSRDSYYEIIGVVYLKRKRKSFYYLIEPFALGGGPGLLFSSFAGKGYRLKSGQSL